MTSLLDDVKRILELGYGDIPRLTHIKETLEANKMLYVSDRKYLNKLTNDHPENPEIKTSKYDAGKPERLSPDEELEIDELEEKIRVESEPS
ncbi:MAG: hypothetical protein OES14_02960 [Nitrosopumilus sp.]|jgi:hypothetical protein|nr:hypothetical protein [Nitrosopumilus sp.]MDH3824732.1 hypothetical protein [Nitrosopumilus sp.]